MRGAPEKMICLSCGRAAERSSSAAIDASGAAQGAGLFPGVMAVPDGE